VSRWRSSRLPLAAPHPSRAPRTSTACHHTGLQRRIPAVKFFLSRIRCGRAALLENKKCGYGMLSVGVGRPGHHRTARQ
jgi:ribosomal protein S14